MKRENLAMAQNIARELNTLEKELEIWKEAQDFDKTTKINLDMGENRNVRSMDFGVINFGELKEKMIVWYATRIVQLEKDMGAL